VTTEAGPDYPVTEPIPVLSSRPGLRDMFAALRFFNYRLYLIAQFFANTGGWMQRVAMDWLVLELTGNVALVGLTVTLQFAPSILLGAWAGVISDRANRRWVLVTTQSVGTVVNGVLAVLVLTGAVQAWNVFLAAALTGCSMAIDGPSRSAFVTEMVGSRYLRNAITFNASIFHLGGLLGPAISGALIVVIGSGWSIALNACTSLIAVCALLLMRSRELHPTHRQGAARGQIREALGYAIRKPTILWPIVLLAFVSTFGMNLPVLLTASASETYHTGAAGYGLYSSLAALGAFLGALVQTRRMGIRLRDIVIACGAFGLVVALAGVVPWYGLFLVALVGVGFSRLTFAISAESLVQLSTNLGIRGRVASLYFTVVTGGQALGGVVMGWIAENWGATAAFALGGGVPALAAVVVAVLLARRHRLRVAVDFRRPRNLVRIVRAAG